MFPRVLKSCAVGVFAGMLSLVVFETVIRYWLEFQAMRSARVSGLGAAAVEFHLPSFILIFAGVTLASSFAAFRMFRPQE